MYDSMIRHLHVSSRVLLPDGKDGNETITFQRSVRKRSRYEDLESAFKRTRVWNIRNDVDNLINLTFQF